MFLKLKEAKRKMIYIKNQVLFKVELRRWKLIQLSLGLLEAKVIKW